MYLQHFALTRFPFQTFEHADELFEHSGGREADARLRHLIELQGIGLLTGESGCGKTTVCRRVTSSLNPGLFKVLYVSLSTGSVMDTLQSIAWELGLDTVRTRAVAYREIRNAVSQLVSESRQLPVLVIDEAQHLRHDVLQNLRLLTNFRMDSEPRLCLILIGLTELRRRLSMAVHESLSQRIIVRQHLAGLAREELQPYLDHCLLLAGCQQPLFEPQAVEALFLASRGLPRSVNRIAHYALTAAAIDKSRTVSCEHMQAGCQECSQ